MSLLTDRRRRQQSVSINENAKNVGCARKWHKPTLAMQHC